MATEKTPIHKRIQRAEQGKEEWKIKAQLRREENEKLKRGLKSKEAFISELIESNQAFKDQLDLFQKKIEEQDMLIEKLKKKL